MQTKVMREITFRGLLLGVLITLIFTTANLYLGLKVGLTFASSIPAAVLSMAFFKLLGKNSILENNIVQTQVSAAGTLSAVVFIIPSLFLVGYWSGFDFWQTFLVCAGGGILGVLFTIPFRIELVEKNKLPYPEGRAAAEVLKLGENKESGMKEMLLGASLSSFSILLSQGFRLTSDGFGYFFNIGKAIFQIPVGFSLALVGAGWLVGLNVGSAILLGIFLAWGVLVPLLGSQSNEMLTNAQLLLNSSALPTTLEELGTQIWRDQVRFIGVGVIGISAIWTLLTMLKPTFTGLKNSFSIQAHAPQDLPLKWMAIIFLSTTLILIGVFYQFVFSTSFSPIVGWSLALTMCLSSILIGFLMSATCGYMAGLVGSSSSPISGIGIIGVILLSLIVLGVAKVFSLEVFGDNAKFFIALALFSTSTVIAISTIANDNLQDLKTGQLVGATPWKQEFILMIGCIVGASVIGPVMNLLYEAYGFVGHLPREGMSESNALSAPQALLMSSIAEGIFKSTLDWLHIALGAILGIFLITINFLLQKRKFSLPPLAIGMGIYLPPIVTIPIFFGALLAHFMQKNIPQDKQQTFKRRGILLSSGLIVGESLMGMVLAGAIVISIGNGGDGNLFDFNFLTQGMTEILGFAFFVFALFFIYRTLKHFKQ
ncbi:OPT family oligopeptide transporter [Helicobacter kayseriensis]|uniref:OPT family oligopeptide transporter n=1 Tax=Helicobacter kayseriensis TaxID=2905877 RepID=UPI001E62A6CF|nr:oligopeptide transporter, OPT family [Helicobacter kayseriensis]MCE3047474.1 oligopeptide transporter, OPT family [Helicobacter kayseriensis]MCE3048793.1 oligopeptide transporter, OPT family [Helicobacter kayseriensis]